MAGRGAWNVQGVGGTKQYKDPSKPGPYYFTGSGYLAISDPNAHAVRGAVKAYQTALTEQGFPCVIDGLYGSQTTTRMTAWQQAWAATGDPKASVWGGAGPETSEQLLRPTLVRVYKAAAHHAAITLTVISGVVRSESRWDAGAVGFQDETDVGLAQINAGAHPEWDFDERLLPGICFGFIIQYLNDSMKLLKYNLRDSIASYNLGVGGARLWIAAGRPDVWTPAGMTVPRNVKEYIDKILAG